jgi:hypothetical protein
MFPVFRFDGMETADWEPDRRTMSVRLNRNAVNVRPGVKIYQFLIRFDGMETADWESDRRTTVIRLSQITETGRLGVKISHMYFLYSGLMVWKQLT